MKCKFSIFFIILLIFLPYKILKAQNPKDNFYFGYIKTDTSISHGFVFLGKAKDNALICKYKLSTKSQVQIFSPTDIFEYGTLEERYVSAYIKFPEISVQNVFLQVLVEGEISAYYLKYEKENYFFIQRDSLQIILLKSNNFKQTLVRNNKPPPIKHALILKIQQKIKQ